MNENGSTAAAVPLENGQAATPAIKIDDGVAIPKHNGGRPKGSVRTAMEALAIGQSFCLPILDRDATKTAIYGGRTAANLAPKKFTRRILIEAGERVVRVWRTA